MSEPTDREKQPKKEYTPKQRKLLADLGNLLIQFEISKQQNKSIDSDTNQTKAGK